MGIPRIGCAIVALVLVASGCRTTFVRHGTVPEPTPSGTPVRVGSEVRTWLDALPSPREPAARDGTDGEGVFVFTADDQNGERPQGIPFVVTGPVDGTFVSDAEGTVRFAGPPGTYRVRVPVGCSGAVEVLEGGAGRFGVAEGQEGSARIPVRWRHRFAPGAPAAYSVLPYWPLGEEVEVRHDVVDRCEGGVRAPQASIGTYRYETGPRLEVVGEPALRSDPDGHAFVTVRCLEEGPPALAVLDRSNPPDRLDLVDARLTAEQGLVHDEGPICGNPHAD